jgi:hypothetical protein
VDIGIGLDPRYAPDVLICRFRQWPSPEQQAAMLDQMLTLGLRRPITSALLDLTALHDLPDPDTVAEALARAVGKNALFSRAACVVRTGEQKQFAALLRRMSARPDDLAIFESEDEGLKWLGIDPGRPRR